MVGGGHWLLLVALAAVPPSAPPPDRPAILTSDAFVGEVSRLRAEVERLDEGNPAAAGEIVAGLPRVWQVHVQDITVAIESAWLKDALDGWRRRPNRERRQDLIQRLRAYEAEATRVDALPDQADARRVLESILARREFARVQGPSAMDSVRQAVYRWLLNLLARLAGSSSVPTVTRWLVIALVAAAVALVAAWVYRTLRRTQQLDGLRLPSPASDSRSWRHLLAASRTAADRGEWREAVHLAYWTAIAFLESDGAWRPDRSRTPREYLTLVAPSNAMRAPLESITRVFEQVWYAAARADAGRFDQALRALERLGCLSR